MMDLRYSLLFLLPLLGGFIALRIRHVNRNLLKLILAFSGAFLFSITIIDILPSLYLEEHTLTTGIFILAGFFFQIVLEYFTKGIEHGHLHHGHATRSLPVSVIAGLCVHSFIEGMPLSESGFLDPTQRMNLIYGVALHEAPAAFTLITLLKHHRVSYITTVIVLILYSAMSLIGIGSSTLLSQFAYFTTDTLRNVLALVVGTFLHISTTILFENSENHSFSRFKLVAISVGVTLALLVSWGG
jgi:zinc and cadmium transporter